MQITRKKHWYVIRIRSNSERLAKVGLHNKQFQVFNPTYKTLSLRRDRKKILNRPIFDGYIFIRTFLNPECHLEILKTPGVVEILKNSRGPIPVPDYQIENVRLLEKHTGIFFSRKKFEIGEAVLVNEGPLAGLRGKIDKMDRKKLHINVDAIPGSVTISISPYQVQLEKDDLYSLVSKKSNT
tara:strand:+ start:584 stop:1132 length:549 start_codon:yes stop_codon:yes gene_type:complete